MYVEVTPKALRALVAEKGHVIEWCGSRSKQFLAIHTRKDGTRHKYKISSNSMFDYSKLSGTLRNGEADDPGTKVSPCPPNEDFSAVPRAGAILGINISGSCESGCANEYTEVSGCICGYDLELDLRDEVKGGFPSPSVSILSSALWCTCGYRLFLTSMSCNASNSVGNLTSSEIASSTIDAVSKHSPLWLVGWNCYSFDNTCLYYHSPESYHEMFELVKVGAAGTVNYGYILNIMGTYNVDGYGFMLRNPYYNYKDMSLAGVANAVGAKAKTDMPDLRGDIDIYKVMDYNMNDSAAAVDVWIKSGAYLDVPSLAVCCCAPVYDTVRYMTGALAGCVYSSEAVSKGMMIDWSRSTRKVRYEGGMVLSPVKGIHEGVVIADYSSMYPTIMVDARISPETVVIVEECDRPYADVWFDDNGVYVSLGTCTAIFPVSGSNTIRDAQLKMTSRRNQYKKSKPTYAGSLKQSSNSIYGATGYENSPMYSPVCSACVTAIGRWCLALACKVFEREGLRVVYGDTDSCVCTASSVTHRDHAGDVVTHAKHALAVLHQELQRTPFKSMVMSFESYHPRMMLLEKKKYCLSNVDGTLKFKGMSVARRDTIGLCKHACESISRIVMEHKSRSQMTNDVSRYLCAAISAAFNRTLTASDISMVKKRDQKLCYVYVGGDGEEKSTPIDVSSNTVADYSTAQVLKLFRSEVLRLIVPCGLGSIQDVISASTVFE